MGIVLELIGYNSTPKASSWEEGCPSIYKNYLCHILKRCETLKNRCELVPLP